MDYIQKLPSHLDELILNNCQQWHDLIMAGTEIQPYSLLGTMEATEEQRTFSPYVSMHLQVHP
jgi:hypothetical protein